MFVYCHSSLSVYEKTNSCCLVLPSTNLWTVVIFTPWTTKEHGRAGQTEERGGGVGSRRQPASSRPNDWTNVWRRASSSGILDIKPQVTRRHDKRWRRALHIRTLLAPLTIWTSSEHVFQISRGVQQ